jgi:hypothetical protein
LAGVVHHAIAEPIGLRIAGHQADGCDDGGKESQ